MGISVKMEVIFRHRCCRIKSFALRRNGSMAWGNVSCILRRACEHDDRLRSDFPSSSGFFGHRTRYLVRATSYGIHITLATENVKRIKVARWQMTFLRRNILTFGNQRDSSSSPDTWTLTLPLLCGRATL